MTFHSPRQGVVAAGRIYQYTVLEVGSKTFRHILIGGGANAELLQMRRDLFSELVEVDEERRANGGNE